MSRNWQFARYAETIQYTRLKVRFISRDKRVLNYLKNTRGNHVGIESLCLNTSIYNF